MKEIMQNLLVISAIGRDRLGIVDSLSETIAEYSCNVSESRMTVLGSEFAIIMMIAGNWDAVARLENNLPHVAEKLNLMLTIKRTERRTSEAQLLSYMVEVVSMDHPGVVRDIAKFFAAHNINIEELQTSSYAAAHTGTPMFSMNMNISIPADLSIAALRGEFMDMCDELNLDAMLAPMK